MQKEIYIKETLKTSEIPGQGELFSETHSIRTFSENELLAFYRASFPESSLDDIFSRARRAKEALFAKLSSGEPFERELARCIIYDTALSKLVFVLADRDKVLREIERFWEKGLEDK